MANQLTQEQQRVVAHHSQVEFSQAGHAKVVAVAGAGKTTTLLNFVLAQLKQGVPAKRILVLMYNKSAQLDFSQRLKQQAHQQALNYSLPDVRTFHSLAYRIYQRLADQGLLNRPQGKILSDGEIESVIWRLLQQVADSETKQDILAQKKKWVEPAVNFIELVKSDLLTPELVFEQIDLPSQCRIFIEAFYLFEQWRKQQQRISFSDMLYDPCQLFVAQPEVGQQFSAHMQWVLVDEYQDINGIQQFLLKVLYGDIYQCAKAHSHLMVIGDPDQTIYEFRGSKPDYILQDFQQDFSGNNKSVIDYQLSQTFRYGHHIALLANNLIHHNDQRQPVLTVPYQVDRSDGQPGQCALIDSQVEFHYGESYAQQTVTLIDDLFAQGVAPQNIAILHRLWGISAPIELALLQKQIAYKLDHKYMVLDRFELDVFWQLFRLAAGQYIEFDQEQRQKFWQIMLTTPFPKIKRPLLNQLAKDLAADEHDHSDSAQLLWQNLPDDLSKWQKQTLEDRGHILDMAERAQDKASVKAWHIAQQYVETTDFYEGIKDTAFSSQQIDERVETIKAFINFLKTQDISAQKAFAYLSELKQQHTESNTPNQQRLFLTSIHKSKGLEWPVVIIPALSHKYFPYKAEGEFATAASEESERRLLYVAMTRAQQQLHLVIPRLVDKKSRLNKADKIDKQDSRFWPSKFIAEMHPQEVGNLYRLIQQGAGQLPLVARASKINIKDLFVAYLTKIELSEKIIIEQAESVASPAKATADEKRLWPKYQMGQWLQHSKLGKGKVVKDDDEYVTLLFSSSTAGKKLSKQIACHFLSEI